MTKKSPNVIFKTMYSLALNGIDNKCQTKKYKDNRLKDVNEMLNYFSDKKKKTVGMFEYYMGHTRFENVNLVLENGCYATKQDIKKIKNEYKKYIENSNLWKGILSFKPEYIRDNISIQTLEEKMSKEIMPLFLKYCGFKDIKNMSYVFSIHTNTAHPHIHFAFIEKKPNYVYCNNKINYRRKGKITLDEQRYLKRLVELVIEREKCFTPLITKTNEDIDYLKSYFNSKEKNFILRNIDEIFIEEKILLLGELLRKYRIYNNQSSKRIKYNSIKNDKIGKEIKQLTKDIKNYLFNNPDSSLYRSKKELDGDIRSLNNYFDKLNELNNEKTKTINNSIATKKQNYIDNYIYNAIVNHSLYKYNYLSAFVKSKNHKNEITIDDLIHEIVYLKSKNNFYNEKERRKAVLDNYFKGNDLSLKFPNKYKVEKALKNINYEMEKASHEFSKLFNYEKELL